MGWYIMFFQEMSFLPAYRSLWLVWLLNTAHSILFFQSAKGCLLYLSILSQLRKTEKQNLSCKHIQSSNTTLPIGHIQNRYPLVSSEPSPLADQH